jgi:glycosyltransferase involved in cell wall biosynthesis
VIAIYADRLQRRGHAVTVVSTPLPQQTFLDKTKSLLRARGWPRNHEPEESYFEGIDVPHHVLEKTRPVVDNDVPDADVVLATFWITAPWVASLSRTKGAKAIFLQGYETSPGHEHPQMDAAWQLPLHKIVISRWLVDLARERFGDSHVHHVPNSVDLEQFHAPERGKQCVPTVGMLYAPIHLKGTDVSVAALESVKKHIPNLRVLAFGATRVSDEYPLPEWIQFVYRPPQSEIRELYAHCDAWLCGSRREGFHLPPLEAMACRCPVVSTRVGGPQDTVEDGKNGFLVSVEDSAALAERLMHVLKLSETEWRQMSDAALETATRYTWDDATTLMENALQDVLTGRSS